MQTRHAVIKATGLLMTVMFSAAASSQQPVTGYAPVNGLKMYYEIHGKGEPVVLLHGSFMTIPGNWPEMIPALAKTRRVIAVEMQGHGRTADINRDFSYDNLADDIAAMLDYLKVAQGRHHRLQHGWRRRARYGDPPSGQGAQSGQHLGCVP